MCPFLYKILINFKESGEKFSCFGSNEIDVKNSMDVTTQRIFYDYFITCQKSKLSIMDASKK